MITNKDHKAAKDYSGFQSDESCEGLNLIALDQMVGFLKGIEHGRKHPGPLVEALVEALNVIAGRGWTGCSPEDYKCGVAQRALAKYKEALK